MLKPSHTWTRDFLPWAQSQMENYLCLYAFSLTNKQYGRFSYPRACRTLRHWANWEPCLPLSTQHLPASSRVREPFGWVECGMTMRTLHGDMGGVDRALSRDAARGTWLTCHFLPETDFLYRIQGSHSLPVGEDKHKLHALFHELNRNMNWKHISVPVHWNLVLFYGRLWSNVLKVFIVHSLRCMREFGCRPWSWLCPLILQMELKDS